MTGGGRSRSNCNVRGGWHGVSVTDGSRSGSGGTDSRINTMGSDSGRCLSGQHDCRGCIVADAGNVVEGPSIRADSNDGCCGRGRTTQDQGL